MKGHGIAWIAAAAAAGAVAIVVTENHARTVSQSVALAQARLMSLDLRSLKAEHRKLESVQLSAREREQLEAKHAEADTLRARLASLQDEMAKPAPEEVESVKVLAGDWTNAGRETPRSAMVSILWSASHGDVDRLASLVGFSPDVRAQAGAMYARLPPSSQQEYGSPEKVVATLLAGSFPKDASAVNILADRQWGQDAGIFMSIDHSEGQVTNMFTFHRAPDGWQLLVPASVMAGYEKTLMGDSRSSDAGSQ